MAKVTFSKADSAFYTTLKQRAENYFNENNMQRTGDWRLWHKAVILISLWIGLYFTLLFVAMPAWTAILLSAILGLVMASIGFNVMHDACHGSFSTNDTVNEIMGYTLNILGGNSFLWKQKHNIIHHTYTNVDGVDDDIAKSPVIRQCYTQKWVPAHKVQHLYLPFIYAITSLAWVFIMDFQKYFSYKIYTTERWKMNFKENAIFWLGKLFFLIVYMIIPIKIVGFMPWLICFLTLHITMGFALSLVFQLAHVVEGAHFESAYQDLHVENNWAVHQVLTTANFAPKNLIINWYVGGLNFQVEHHLFPKVSHIHYPALRKIVIETCKEYNIPYNEFPTMGKAIASHFKMMKEFGQNQFHPTIAA